MLQISSSPFGCHISEVKRQVGGAWGYSGGNCRIALKKPPSLHSHTQSRPGTSAMRTTAAGQKGALVGVRWAHDCDLPLKQVLIVCETC